MFYIIDSVQLSCGLQLGFPLILRTRQEQLLIFVLLDGTGLLVSFIYGITQAFGCV
jgi:hypothetical protein